MDLTDPGVRAAVSARLGELYAGRPVLVGPGMLAGWTPVVEMLRELGCEVLVLSAGRGAGPVPGPDACTVVEIDMPATLQVTDELRQHDRLLRELPSEAAARIEEFDPERRGLWFTSPFVTTDEPILGRPVTGGRPRSFVALEDKLLADEVWAAADVEHAPYRIVELDRDALARATDELSGPLGAVWSGDARDGFNGGGNYVRWIRDREDQVGARAFFATRCDRVRVMPFLEGVPCSIHGFVLPDGTAALRPVEIVMLRNEATRTFVYAGLGTTWDPPSADREVMREVARRVGVHLQRAHGYRGAFGVDGVLTADGFRPTELNTRMSAGAITVADLDRMFFTLLQASLVTGLPPQVTAQQVESLVELMDQRRVGRAMAFIDDARIDGEISHPVRWDGESFSRSDEATGTTLVGAPTPSGLFAKIDPAVVLEPGQRLARVNLALLDFLHREHGVGPGLLVAAPDVR